MLEESVGEDHPDFIFFVKEYNKIMGEGDFGAQSVQWNWEKSTNCKLLACEIKETISCANEI